VLLIFRARRPIARAVCLAGEDQIDEMRKAFDKLGVKEMEKKNAARNKR